MKPKICELVEHAVNMESTQQVENASGQTVADAALSGGGE